MNMMVEYAESPLAIGTRTPRFTWEVPLAGRGRRQGAYHILVASSEEMLEAGRADLWDSGKVESSQSVNVPYDGKELQSNRDCFWKVRLWDEAGADVGFGGPARFGTALLDESDWEAKWIGMGDPDEPSCDPAAFQQERVPPEVQEIEPDPRAPLLRKSFEIDRPVRRARAFVCGLGLHELRINGEKAGDAVLATPRTDFRKRALYMTYDITAAIKAGANAVGLVLGNGWFNGQKKYWGWQMQWYGSPRAIAQLEIEFEDGSRERIVTDDSWRGDWSPITANCIYDGEEYDARLEQPGWDTPGFDASSWRPVNLVKSPGGTLAPATHEPELVVETIRPVSLCEPRPGAYVFDLGKNITGWARLRVAGGERGAEIRLRFAEAIHQDGTINPASQNAARQADSYVVKGPGEEVHEPRFTYHGFRYVEVTGYPGAPGIDAIEGRFARAAVARTGAFECASDAINNIPRCTLQSQLCNIQMGVPTDDTQRPERLGWGADAWGTAQEALYNLWMPRVYDKWIADFRDQQDESGMVGMIAPQAGAEEDLVWTAAFLLIPWWQYVHCGDRRILDESYDAFQRYIEFLGKTGQKDVRTAPPDQVIGALLWRCGKGARLPAEEDRGHLQISQWGDHLATAEGSASRANLPLSMATAFYYLDVKLMAKIASALGKEDDAARHLDLAEEIKGAFNDRFFDPNTGYYDTGVQSAQAWPLAFGLVPEEHRERVLRYFVASVGDRQRRLTTGYVGTKFALQVLSMAERDDIVWRLANASEYPSWRFMLRNDRTTSCERWDGDGGSLNHAPLGAAIDEWFYSGLAGIRADESAPGFERVIIKPYLPADLRWARASLKTVRGTVTSEWHRDGATARLSVAIPANASGTIFVPTGDVGRVTEGPVPVAESEGVSGVSVEDGRVVLQVGSGDYVFEFPAP